MIEIKIDGTDGFVHRKGSIPTVMAEMCMAIHTFYNDLSENEKRWFKRAFWECSADIFSDDKLTADDIDKACDKQEEKKKEEVKDIDELLNTLKELKGILKELSE